jgi:hypothetical protein
MEPRFQSSFIPRGPVSSSIPTQGMSMPKQSKPRDIFSLIATTIFTLSILFALGTFGYKFYLNYSIERMKGELEMARAALEPETVEELIRLNSRLVSTEQLVKQHRILSPIFNFLETATPKSIRYTKFDFNKNAKGLELTLEGQARGYAALAVAAEVINQNPEYLKNPVFSDLLLDDRGNVVFTMKAQVNPQVLSYERNLEMIANTQAPAVSTTTQSVATSSPTNR